MNGNSLLRIAALLCFVLSAFGISVGGMALLPIGLAAWVASTFV